MIYVLGGPLTSKITPRLETLPFWQPAADAAGLRSAQPLLAILESKSFAELGVLLLGLWTVRIRMHLSVSLEGQGPNAQRHASAPGISALFHRRRLLRFWPCRLVERSMAGPRAFMCHVLSFCILHCLRWPAKKCLLAGGRSPDCWSSAIFFHLPFLLFAFCSTVH